ncbi:hypothetical protein BH09SUM1_BH09SUM1_23890 [soil metagenome]
MLIAAGVALLTIRLGAASLSNDEANYARNVSRTWSELFAFLHTEIHPPLYYIFLKCWTGFSGIGETALRLSSIPFAIACWFVLRAWTKKNVAPDVAFLALTLFVLSPFFLFLSRLAKYFPAVTLLSLGSVCLLWKLCEEEHPRRRRTLLLIAWGACSLALLWTHYIGAVTWAAMIGWILIRVREDRRRAKLLLWLGIFAIGFVPQLAHLFMQAREAAAGESTAVIASPMRRTFIQLAYSAYAFAVGHTLSITHPFIAAIAAVTIGGAFFMGLFQLRRSGNRPLAFATYFFFTQFIGAFVLMRVMLPGHPDLAASERLSFTIPWFAVICAAGIASVGRSKILFLAYAFPASTSILSMLTGAENNSYDYIIPWRTIAEDAAAQHPDMIVVDDWHLGARGWYYLRLEAKEFVELRGLRDNNEMESFVDNLPPDTVVVFLRSTRDASVDSHVDRFEALLTARIGIPAPAGFVREIDETAGLKAALKGEPPPLSTERKITRLRFGSHRDSSSGYGMGLD